MHRLRGFRASVRGLGVHYMQGLGAGFRVHYIRGLGFIIVHYLQGLGFALPVALVQ